jgi:hypothetical protein
MDRKDAAVAFPQAAYSIRMSWPRRISAEKKRQEEREHHAQEDRGGQREIERKISPLNVDIPGELTQPWNLSSQDECGPKDHQNYPEDNQPFADIVHGHWLAGPLGAQKYFWAPSEVGHWEA